MWPAVDAARSWATTGVEQYTDWVYASCAGARAPASTELRVSPLRSRREISVFRVDPPVFLSAASPATGRASNIVCTQSSCRPRSFSNTEHLCNRLSPESICYRGKRKKFYGIRHYSFSHCVLTNFIHAIIIVTIVINYYCYCCNNIIFLSSICTILKINYYCCNNNNNYINNKLLLFLLLLLLLR